MSSTTVAVVPHFEFLHLHSDKKGEEMEASKVDHLFVITGGPGSGKSTLINALGERGITNMPEAGRAIIQDQVAIGGEALPWADRRAFAELMLSWEMRSHRAALRLSGPVIFDRGVPDVVGYLRLNDLPIPSHVERAAQMFRYHHRVFVAPPWPEIFTADAERKQSFEEARATCAAMIETYSMLGYELISLPLGSVEERVKFVLAAIG
jgi:predicted ATPase